MQMKCKFDGRNYNSDQWWNNNKWWCKCKKIHVCEKDYVWNPATCNCENGKYLASVIDDSATMSNDIIESYDDERYFNEKKVTCKIQNFYILLLFLIKFS